MSENTPIQNNKTKKAVKKEIKINGLDIDKAEYREIVLSHSNNPYNLKQNYYD